MLILYKYENLAPSCNDLSAHYDLRVHYELSACANGKMD